MVVDSASTSAEAGVLIGEDGPVYLSSPGHRTPAAASDIQVGDLIQVWQETVSYGAAQAPAGKQCYLGRQIVILR